MGPGTMLGLTWWSPGIVMLEGVMGCIIPGCTWLFIITGCMLGFMGILGFMCWAILTWCCIPAIPPTGIW